MKHHSSIVTRPTAAARVSALVGISLVVAALAGCTVAPPRNDDPLERYNRKVFAFNDAMDKAVIRPVAVGYRKVTSPNVRRAVSNFFANVRMPVTIANDLLQGKVVLAARNTARLAVNTTAGFAGLFDPASKMRMPPNENDFGVTLAKWGVPDGPYLVLPLIGSTSVRDVWRFPVDSYFFDPLAYYARNQDLRYGAQYYPTALYLVTLRARAIDAEGLLEGVYDPYLFFRDAFRQRRIYDIYDGNPPDSVIEKMEGIDDIDIDKLLEEQRQYEHKKDDSDKP